MYQYTDVTTQTEFDAAIAAGDYPHITTNGRYEIREIPKGHIIKVSGTAKPHLVAYDSSSPRTEAHGSSSPLTVAHDYSSVLHTGRGTVIADEHVTVRTSGQVTVTGGAHVQRVPLTTNPGVLRGSLAFIEAHPEQWNQGAWAMKTDCGTAYCMAGHIVAQIGGRMDVENSTVEVASLPASVRPRFRLEHVQISAAARAIAGMSEDTAERLFSGGNDLDDLRELVDEICEGAFDPQPAAPADTATADAQ